MSKLGERERDRAAAAVISDLRCLVGQWSPAAGDHAAELWAHELDGALSTLRHAIDDEWEDAVACRGSDESCDAAWPCTGIKRSDRRWAADRWCRIVLGVLRNRPEEFEDPYDAVLGVGLWIVGKHAEATEQDWARWTEANTAAVTAIADMLTSQLGNTTVADADRFEPAAWFEFEARIKPTMLRKAASQNRKSMKVRKTGEGKGTRYSVRDAKANWPDRFAEIRRKREAPH